MMLKKIKEILTKKYNCPVGIIAYLFTAAVFSMGIMFGHEIAGKVDAFFPGQYLVLAMITGYFSHMGVYHRGQKLVHEGQMLVYEEWGGKAAKAQNDYELMARMGEALGKEALVASDMIKRAKIFLTDGEWCEVLKVRAEAELAGFDEDELKNANKAIQESIV